MWIFQKFSFSKMINYSKSGCRVSFVNNLISVISFSIRSQTAFQMSSRYSKTLKTFRSFHTTNVIQLTSNFQIPREYPYNFYKNKYTYLELKAQILYKIEENSLNTKNISHKTNKN